MKARARARSAVGRTRRRLDGVEGVGDGGGGGVRRVEGPGMGDGSRRGRAGVSGRPLEGCGVGVVEVAGTLWRGASNSVAESSSESSPLGSVMQIANRQIRNYFVC